MKKKVKIIVECHITLVECHITSITVSNYQIQIDTEVKVIEETLNINEETGLISPTDILTQGMTHIMTHWD